jgi:hypothetical protein
VDFDGDGDVATRTLTRPAARTIGIKLSMGQVKAAAQPWLPVQSSTLAGHVAVAVAVKVHDHD